jgi:hypothetical protein
MFIASPTRDLFSYSVERIALVVLLLVVVVVGIRRRHRQLLAADALRPLGLLARGVYPSRVQ